MDPIGPYDDHMAPDGRVMEVLSEHNCEGWLEGYVLTGRHGVFATYEAFAMVPASMAVQHTKWLVECGKLEWRAPVPSLNVLLTSTCWRNDHNGFSHQGPGLIDTMLEHAGRRRPRVPAARRELPALGRRPLPPEPRLRQLIVIDKQPQLQWLDIDAAKEHCARGASRWDWASSDDDDRTPTSSSRARATSRRSRRWRRRGCIRQFCPDLKVRVVNVVDLTVLFPRKVHPHGMRSEDFVELFTAQVDVTFAFHGYARAMHQMLHGRPDADRFHVHGFWEQGTTTTPFDMVVLNEMSRYHLAAHAVHRTRAFAPGIPELLEHCSDMLERHHSYVREHLDDMPEVRDWVWT